MPISIATLAFSQILSLGSAEVKNSLVEFNGGRYNGYLIELNAPPINMLIKSISYTKVQWLFN